MNRVAALVIAVLLSGCGFFNGGDSVGADAGPPQPTISVYGVPLFDDFLTLDLYQPTSQIPVAEYINPTAVGGQQTLELAAPDYSVYTGTYTASVVPGGNGAVAVAATAPSTVTVVGAGSGSDTLRVTGLGDAANFTLDAAPLDTVMIASSAGEEYSHGVELAFVPDNVAIGVVLARELDGVVAQRLVDTSLTVSGLAGATRMAWDSFHATGVALGPYSVTVTAAGFAPQTFPIMVVDGPDRVVARAKYDVQIDDLGSAKICFDAYAGSTLVAGLTWSFDVAVPSVHSGTKVADNCLAVVPNGATVAGNVTAGAVTSPFSVAITQ